MPENLAVTLGGGDLGGSLSTMIPLIMKKLDTSAKAETETPAPKDAASITDQH
jgi:hypothetical protein